MGKINSEQRELLDLAIFDRIEAADHYSHLRCCIASGEPVTQEDLDEADEENKKAIKFLIEVLNEITE